MHRGPLIPMLALAAGIAISNAFEMAWWCGIIPIAIAITLYLYILRMSSDPVSSYRVGKWHIAWVILLFTGTGMTDESLSRPMPIEEAYGIDAIPEELYGEVTGVLTKTYGERIDVIIEGTNGAKARIRTGVTELSPGDIIKIPSGRIRHISADTTETGKKIEPMLKAAGIMYSGWISPSRIETEGRSRNPVYIFTDIREEIEGAIERSHLSKHTADFLKAILLGDKSGLDEQTRLTFANGGMAHILALSGLHIGILAGFLLMLMWPLKLAGRYKWGYMLALLILWLYVAITGFAYSSVRACIMTSFAFIAIAVERKNFAGNALCSACLLILLADPKALFDAGFQLSVVCVGALIAYAPKLNPISHRQHPILYAICGALIATMVATGASWVLTSYYFSQIPLMFLPSNVILLPILPFFLSMAVVYVGALCMGTELNWLGNILDNGYHVLLKGVEWLSGGPEFVVDYQLPLWGAAMWILLLGAGAYIINRQKTT